MRRALVAAQVEALKMKLQPHFLFNTLNSISFLAVEKDVDGVVTMVERLGGLLRSSMQVTGSQLVTVREELALADQYLAIEEIRFTDRLTVTRRIAPGVLDALIPSLVLQPMIENSIKHGFSRRIDASRLEIAIRRDGDALVVTVEDDGPGVPPGWDLATHCGRGPEERDRAAREALPGRLGLHAAQPGAGRRDRQTADSLAGAVRHDAGAAAPGRPPGARRAVGRAGPLAGPHRPLLQRPLLQSRDRPRNQRVHSRGSPAASTSPCRPSARRRSTICSAVGPAARFVRTMAIIAMQVVAVRRARRPRPGRGRGRSRTSCSPGTRRARRRGTTGSAARSLTAGTLSDSSRSPMATTDLAGEVHDQVGFGVQTRPRDRA